MSRDPTETNGAAEPRPARAKEQLAALAKRIRSLREKRGVTQEDFAARCGISVSFVSLLERGERSPSYETILEVAKALEVPLAELFRDPPAEGYDDPYYAKLLEFARRSRLSRADVDRWVAVGQAMFSRANGDDAAGRVSRRSGTSCQVESCGRPVLAKGMCASHYHRARRARMS